MMNGCRTRWRRLEFFMFCGVIVSGLRPGVDAFCTLSLGRPNRTHGTNRRPAVPAATTTVRAANDNVGFESIGDLEALTVVRLKAELKKRGLKQSGKKSDLVRLLASAPGVIVQPPPPAATAGPAFTPDNVLSDEEVARWMENDAPAPARTSRPPTRAKANAGGASPQAVVAEEVPGGLPAAKTFSSSRLGSSAAARDLIKDAELADAAPLPRASAVSRAAKSSRGRMGLPRMKEKVASSSRGEVGDPVQARKPPPVKKGGSKRGETPQTPPGSPPPPPPEQQQLPGPTEEMRKKAIIMDLLERRTTTFELEEGLQPALVPRSDVYVVSTKKALRPWDGPHADRAETHVVVLLTDVFGWNDSFTRNTADEIAEICDAIVVVPDMFRERPWTHEQPEDEYEAWRDSHDPDDVASDIRACVDFARKEYKPTSLGLVGFCYGGGRALEEAAAGVVEPDSVVVFYPTRYDVDEVGPRIACPVAAFFAENDVLPGAAVEDAQALREQLRENENVPDFQIKLCPGAGHGFAHRPMEKDKENAEDAMLLATSWLEMYLQKHFPAPPGGVKESEFGFWELPARS